jgi:phosphotransferase system HPr (HPr) family protein
LAAQLGSGKISQEETLKTEINLIIKNEVGLHARPASLFVKTANKYQSKIMVRNVTRDGKTVSAKSILSVLTLAVLCNHEIHIEAEGTDAEAAIADMQQLVESDFSEAKT